jgi:hypothetical protein
MGKFKKDELVQPIRQELVDGIMVMEVHAGDKRLENAKRIHHPLLPGSEQRTHDASAYF